jgi:hypothetical protein
MSEEDDKMQRSLSRGAQAETLLSNKLLNECFDTLEAEYGKALFLTTPTDTTSREKLYLAVNVLRKVKDQLRLVADDGKITQKQIQLLTDPERKKLFGII